MFKRLLLTTAFLLSSPAFAQDYNYTSNGEINDRLERIERDLQVTQRQLARGGSAPTYTGGGDVTPGAAGLEVRVSAMEEQVRRLQGKVEENEFQVRKANENLTRYQKDLELRLQEMEQKLNAAPAAHAEPMVDNSVVDDTAAKADKKVPKGNKEAEAPKEAPTVVEDEAPQTSRDLYQSSYRLVQQTRYEDAAKGFKSFTEKYPKDPLVGNAWYWLGETYYIRKDYVKAADSFRQGFESMPAGTKAADNLLKLSMSLSALKKTQEACVVLDQIAVKFKDTAAGTVQKATTQRAQLGCK